MSIKKIFLIFMGLVLVSSDGNFKGRFSKNVFKEARFLSFNTSNDDITEEDGRPAYSPPGGKWILSLVDIRGTCQHQSRMTNVGTTPNALHVFDNVSLDFNIPFLTIPVKTTMDSAFGFAGLGLPTMNINMAALVLGGIVVFVSTLLPLLQKGHSSHYSHLHRARMSDDTEIGAVDVLDIFNQIMRDPNGVHGCAERVACWMGQKTDAKSLKILNQIISNDILASMFNTTIMEYAIKFGQNGKNCDLYTPCHLHEEHLVKLINKFPFGRHSSNNG